MKCWQVDIVNAAVEPANGGYIGIDDPDTDALKRCLYIEDSEGRIVALRGAEIGALYRAIKPALAG